MSTDPADPLRPIELSVVLPAFNEEANILDVLDAATKVAERLCTRHEIIVVDDGSTDATAQLVAERESADPRVRLVRHRRNCGYGQALRTGFQAAQLDLVFFTDADRQFDLEELELLLPWIDRVHVVAGYRLDRQDPWQRRLVAHAWNSLVRVLFYVPVRDIDCAFKLFRRSVLVELDLQAMGNIVNTEVMVKLGRSGHGVVEVGVRHFPRVAGKARGVNLKVIITAFAELYLMYGKLQNAGLSTVPPPPILDAASSAPSNVSETESDDQ